MKLFTVILSTIFLFTILFVFTIYPNDDSNSQNQKITIQKRVDNANNYEDFNEITDEKKVQKAIKIVKNANWTNVKVEMSRYPDYKFQFPFKDSDGSEDKIASYSLWVNANGKKIEIVTDGGKYVELIEQESKVLYEIFIGQS